MYQTRSCTAICKNTFSVNSPRVFLILLDKLIYRLKQAPRAWFNHFATFITGIGFTPTRSDS